MVEKVSGARFLLFLFFSFLFNFFSTPLHILHLLLLLVLVLQRLQPLLVQLAAQQAAGDAAQELLVGRWGHMGREGGVRKAKSG